jgi:hypothetical protein
MTLTATPKHDLIHRFIFQVENRYKVLKYLSEKRKFEFNKDFSSSIEMEKPIFANNGSRRFIIDGIIDLFDQKNCGPGGKSVRSFNGKEFKIPFDSCTRKIVYEGKPQLLSVSSTISQLKSYSYHLKYHR